MNTLTQIEFDQINELSSKIDNGSANVDDYIKYEKFLIKAGFRLQDIRAKLTLYGFKTYHEYIDVKNSAKTREERRITNVIIVAWLVVLKDIVHYLINSGRLNIIKDQTQ